MTPVVSAGTLSGHSFVRVEPKHPERARALVVVPGLNDPLKRVGDARWFAGLMALYLRRYRDTHAAYMLSRPHGLGGARTTREMADALAPAVREVAVEEGVDGVDVLGLSLGGFVVQHLAALAPDVVDRAVLGLAGTELSPNGHDIVQRWRTHALEERWRPIYVEAYGLVARGFTARVLQTASVGYDRLSTPAAPEDFLTSADASVAHDGRDALHDVTVPTLVLGGTADPFFSEASFRDAARRLPEGTLALLDDVGHDAVVEHSAAFDGAIERFLADTE